jgi:hypothetical protein
MAEGEQDTGQEGMGSGGDYRAFLLRCWKEGAGPEGEPAWRFTLVQLGNNGVKHGFTKLEDLTAFL